MADLRAITAPTVNPEEMSKFAEASASLWDVKGLAKPLHSMNNLRVPLVVDAAKFAGLIPNSDEDPQPLTGLSILDVGCGAGISTEPLAEFGCTIVAIDPCPEMIYEAKKHQALNPTLTNVTYIAGTIEDHVQDNAEKYDMVLAFEVLDHVDNPEMFLELCCKCLKPDGVIIVTTFTKSWFAWLAAIIFAEYILKVTPVGSHSYDSFITPEETEKMLEKFGCKTSNVQGMLFNFLTNTWYWSRFVLMSYALCAIKTN